LKKVDSNSYTSDLYFDDNSKCSITLRKPPSSDFAVFEQVFVLKEYQPLVDLINKNHSTKREPLNIIDAGGNIGLTSIFLNRCYPGSQFAIIEPDTENFKIFERNIQNNNFTSMKAIQGGVWNKDCYLRVARDFRDGNDWAVRVAESDKATNLKGFSIIGLMKLLDFDNIDILKIDIEGSEKQLFMDADAASEFLSKTKYIAIEIHDEFDCRIQINEILTANHFEYFLQDGLTIGVNRKLVLSNAGY
jgi:FkbM family methyltransferase